MPATILSRAGVQLYFNGHAYKDTSTAWLAHILPRVDMLTTILPLTGLQTYSRGYTYTDTSMYMLAKVLPPTGLQASPHAWA